MRWVWGDGVSTGWVYGSAKQRGDEGGTREKKKMRRKKRRNERSRREKERKKKRKYFFNERRKKSFIYIYIYINLVSCYSAQLFMAMHCSYKLEKFSYGTTIAACFLSIGGAKNSNIAI